MSKHLLLLLHASVNAYAAGIQCVIAFTQYQPVLCSVNDVEEKYYADGEDAYDMRKPFKQLKHKAAPVKQLKPANVSPQTSDAQTAAPADDKASAAQTDSNPADAEKENTDKVASQEGKPNQSKGKGASGKKR